MCGRLKGLRRSRRRASFGSASRANFGCRRGELLGLVRSCLRRRGRSCRATMSFTAIRGSSSWAWSDSRSVLASPCRRGRLREQRMWWRGTVEIAPGAAMETGGCASRGTLTIRTPEREAIEIDPCAFAGKGGALIDATADGLRLAPARRQENRMWTQPLYAPVPKAASGSQEDPPASQAAPSVKLRVPPSPPASQSREDAAPSKAEAAQ